MRSDRVVPLPAKTMAIRLRPIQSRPTCSARAWWPCSGLSSSRWGSQGVCILRRCERTGPSTRCACPDVSRLEVLYVLLRPTQSRPARSARATLIVVIRWLWFESMMRPTPTRSLCFRVYPGGGGRARAARKVVATQGGGIQRKARIEPLVVRVEATQRACVTLLQ